ncbi:MAG: hypothetical protein NZM11_08395 [Anaerolineales bacterium]|nr:hypothetical protein [Anaerolineales bacterium]
MKALLTHLPQHFWALAGSVSIRTKILGIVLGLVLLLGLGVTAQVRYTLTRAMDAQLQEQSVSVARNVAARAADLILINDLYALHQLLRETQANNLSLRYAFVLDPNGQILAHTFGNGFPAELREANTAQADEHHRTVILNTDEGPVWDTAVPIFDGHAGIARVGLSETLMRLTVDEARARWPEQIAAWFGARRTQNSSPNLSARLATSRLFHLVVGEL